MQVAHQPGALAGERRGPRPRLLAGETGLQFVLGLAHLGDEAAGKAVDLVERAGKPPGQRRADRHQHRRVGQSREEDAPVGYELKHGEHVVNPARQHDGDGAAEQQTGDVLPPQHGVGRDQRHRHQTNSHRRRADEQIQRPDRSLAADQADNGEDRAGCENDPAGARPLAAEEQNGKGQNKPALERRGRDRDGIDHRERGIFQRGRQECLEYAERHRRRQHAVGRFMAAHHPHDRENDRKDRLPGREHDRQGDEQQRPLVVIGAQDVVRPDIENVEKSRDRAPDEQTNGDFVRAIVQQRRRDHRDLGRVAVGPVGGGIAPAVQHHDAVDCDFDGIGEARQKDRPGARRILARIAELAGVVRLLVGGRSRLCEIRQRHRTFVAALLELERGHGIAIGRFGQRLLQDEATGHHDQRLQQHVLDEARGLVPPPLAGGSERCRGVLGHSRIKPCWTASNTASPRVWTSSLR